MSGKAGPSIVTNGLVLSLDASDKNSYTSGSTIWYDLGGNNTGSLINGPAFNSTNQGIITFDGIDDYVNITNYYLSASASSIIVWFNAQTQTNDPGSVLRPIIQQGNFDGVNLPEGIEINMIRSGSVDKGKIRFSWGNAINETHYLLTTSTYDDNKWHMSCLSNNGTNFNIYIDNNLLATKLTYSSVNTSSNLQVGGSTTLSARKFKGSISKVFIYNRALTTSEVLQNYNAIKGRYGL